MSFAESYVGRLRSVVGPGLLLLPGARIVIERPDGLILLQHRSDFQLWGLPGGGPEEGETIGEVIRREVLEETGLLVENPKPFGYACDPATETIRFPNGHQCQYFSLLFHADAFRGTLAIGDGESLALDWFDPARLPDMLPNMRRSVEAFLRFKATGAFQMI